MTKVKIIGIGSPFGSDRTGWDAIDGLGRDINADEVSFIALDRPGVSLLDYMQDVEMVILVDAVKAGLETGSVVRLEEDQIEVLNSVNSTHGFGVAEALALGRALNNLPEKLVLVGMETGDESGWMPLSKDMKELVDVIIKEVDACLSVS